MKGWLPPKPTISLRSQDLKPIRIGQHFKNIRINIWVPRTTLLLRLRLHLRPASEREMIPRVRVKARKYRMFNGRMKINLSRLQIFSVVFSVMTAFREYHFSSDELSRNITCTDSSYLLLFPVTNVHWTYFICCLEIHDEYNVIKSQVLTCSKLATNGHIVWHMIHDQDATTAKRCLITLSCRRTYPPSPTGKYSDEEWGWY